MALRRDEEWVYSLPLAAQHCNPNFLGFPGGHPSTHARMAESETISAARYAT